MPKNPKNKFDKCLKEGSDYECNLLFLDEENIDLCYEYDDELQDKCIFTIANYNQNLLLCDEINDYYLREKCNENLKERIIPLEPWKK